MNLSIAHVEKTCFFEEQIENHRFQKKNVENVGTRQQFIVENLEL